MLTLSIHLKMFLNSSFSGCKTLKQSLPRKHIYDTKIMLTGFAYNKTTKSEQLMSMKSD